MTSRAQRFMDCYRRDLTGRHAARASKKYRGHRVLPNSIMDSDELERARTPA
jgi:hypothetical protein